MGGRVSRAETPGVVIGNRTPKYTSANPAIRWLTNRWVAQLSAVIDRAAREGVTHTLEVGAGEGVISEHLYRRLGWVAAIDLPDAGLRAEWRSRPGPHYLHADAHRLPFRAASFDLVVCVEVLEHLEDPEAGLRDLARVGRRDLILSVPREPLFRASNLLAGRYVRRLGNTPGHLNHWSSRSFQAFVSQIGEIRTVRTPYPWTIVWARL